MFPHFAADFTWKMALERQSHYRAEADRARIVRTLKDEERALDRALYVVHRTEPRRLSVVPRPVPTSGHPSARSRPHPDDRHAA
jgi:hypothetical protein